MALYRLTGPCQRPAGATIAAAREAPIDIRETYLPVQDIARHAGRADEIVLAVAFATGRPNARIQGAPQSAVAELVSRLRGRAP
jgi:hypothetical protein